jgi:hypothetical protein
MKQSTSRAPARSILSLSVVLLGLSGGLSAFTAEAAAERGGNDSKASCQQEMRRVTIWPTGSSKTGMLPRFEERMVTVCNGKVVSWQTQKTLRHAKG